MRGSGREGLAALRGHQLMSKCHSLLPPSPLPRLPGRRGGSPPPSQPPPEPLCRPPPAPAAPAGSDCPQTPPCMCQEAQKQQAVKRRSTAGGREEAGRLVPFIAGRGQPSAWAPAAQRAAAGNGNDRACSGGRAGGTHSWCCASSATAKSSWPRWKRCAMHGEAVQEAGLAWPGSSHKRERGAVRH